MRLHKMLYYCFFGLSPALPGKIGERALTGAGRTRVPIEQLEASNPYLSVIGPPPLRFMEPASALSPATQPPGAASAATSKPDVTAAPPTGSEASPKAPASPPESTTLKAGQPAGPDSTEPTIIPDDMRPRVRPEEFLPFFQLPGSGAPNAPVPNAPDKLPPSSATYRLE